MIGPRVMPPLMCSALFMLALGCPGEGTPSIVGDWAITIEGPEDDVGIRINEDGSVVQINLGSGAIMKRTYRLDSFGDNCVAISDEVSGEMVNVFVGMINPDGTMSGVRVEFGTERKAWSAVII
jgi:hypothetical protein